MDPDNNEPAGAVVAEGRARREHTALETRRIISELLLRVKDRADLTTLQFGALTAVSKMFHVHPRTISKLGSVPSRIITIHMLVCLVRRHTRIKRHAIRNGMRMKSGKQSRLFHTINVEAFDCLLVLWGFHSQRCTE